MIDLVIEVYDSTLENNKVDKQNEITDTTKNVCVHHPIYNKNNS